MEQYINDNNIISIYDLVYTYFTAIDNNENIKKIISIISITPIFVNILLKFMAKIHIIKTNRQSDIADYYTHNFVSSGLHSIFFLWIKNQKEIPLKEFVRLVENILQGKVFE